jgi:hypothetical protein
MRQQFCAFKLPWKFTLGSFDPRYVIEGRLAGGYIE